MKKLFALLITITILLTACQPTPEEAVVVDKKDSIEEKIIENKNENKDETQEDAAGFTQYEAPERFTNTYEKNNVKIMVDAQVEIPPAQNIYSVMLEPKELTQELADSFLDYFIGDAPMYMRTAEGPTVNTLQNEILIWKEAKFNAENKWDEVKNHDPYAGNGSQQETIAYLDSVIKRFEDQLQNAPQKHGYVSISRQLKIPESEGGKDIPDDATAEVIAASKAEDMKAEIANASILQLYGYAEVIESDIEDNMAHIYISGGTGRSVKLSYDNSNDASVANGYRLSSDEYNELGKTISISLEEAIALAQEAMQSLGVGETYFSDFNYNATVKNGQLTPGYSLSFYKSINGMPIIHLMEGPPIDNGNFASYAPPPAIESIRVDVDESDVLGFIWDDMVRQTEVLDENVSIMGFDDVISLFEDKIFQKAYSQDNNLEIVINKISLSLLPIKMQESDSTITVPVWDFRGYHYDPNDIERKNKLIGRNSDHTTYLTINAIDGSIINRKLGY